MIWQYAKINYKLRYAFWFYCDYRIEAYSYLKIFIFIKLSKIVCLKYIFDLLVCQMWLQVTECYLILLIFVIFQCLKRNIFTKISQISWKVNKHNLNMFILVYEISFYRRQKFRAKKWAYVIIYDYVCLVLVTLIKNDSMYDPYPNSIYRWV